MTVAFLLVVRYGLLHRVVHLDVWVPHGGGDVPKRGGAVGGVVQLIPRGGVHWWHKHPHGGWVQGHFGWIVVVPLNLFLFGPGVDCTHPGL